MKHIRMENEGYIYKGIESKMLDMFIEVQSRYDNKIMVSVRIGRTIKEGQNYINDFEENVIHLSPDQARNLAIGIIADLSVFEANMNELNLLETQQ
ncbi:MAG: hypothetical protein HQK65_04145 [Desulfamplus sp.]|nr:hypothetical protein [Desulfamplus sp.]